MADAGQKTEQATPRRLEKARREGNFPSARHFVGGMQFLAFVALLSRCGGDWMQQTSQNARYVLRRAFDPGIGPGELLDLCGNFFWRACWPLLAGGMLIVAVTAAVQLMLTRFGISLKKLSPDFNRLSPLSRIKQLPGQNIPAFFQALIMLPVFAIAVYYIGRDNIAAYMAMPLQSISAGAREIGGSVQKLFWQAAMLFLGFGAVDLFRQQQRYRRELRMSKQEVRDELKEVEGNPMMRLRIRRIRRDLLRRRMMSAVPTATAVVVNPTHFAVALRYDANAMTAPLVVAKGKNFLALRIRQKAIEHQVPLVENPPLAQALYKSAEIGQEIPAHLYRAVAEVLAYIYRIMQGQRGAVKHA